MPKVALTSVALCCSETRAEPVAPPRALANFLRKVNSSRGDLPELTSDSFLHMLRLKDREAVARYMHIFKRVVKCRADRNTCYSDPKKNAVFDPNCSLRVSEKAPFADCADYLRIHTPLVCVPAGLCAVLRDASCAHVILSVLKRSA